VKKIFGKVFKEFPSLGSKTLYESINIKNTLALLRAIHLLEEQS